MFELSFEDKIQLCSDIAHHFLNVIFHLKNLKQCILSKPMQLKKGVGSCGLHTGLSPPVVMQWTLAWYEHPGLRPSQTHSVAKPLYT